MSLPNSWWELPVSCISPFSWTYGNLYVWPNFDELLLISSKLIIRSPCPNTRPYFSLKNRALWCPRFSSMRTLLVNLSGSESLKRYDCLHFLKPPIDCQLRDEKPPKMAFLVLTRTSRGPMLSHKLWKSLFESSFWSESLNNSLGVCVNAGKFFVIWWSRV